MRVLGFGPWRHPYRMHKGVASVGFTARLELILVWSAKVRRTSRNIRRGQRQPTPVLPVFAGLQGRGAGCVGVVEGAGSVRTLGVAIDRGGVRVRINDEDVWSQPLGNRIAIAALPET